eukprot:1280711-Pyramimonas_sp.AAC.1
MDRAFGPVGDGKISVLCPEAYTLVIKTSLDPSEAIQLDTAFLSGVLDRVGPLAESQEPARSDDGGAHHLARGRPLEEGPRRCWHPPPGKEP